MRDTKTNPNEVNPQKCASDLASLYWKGAPDQTLDAATVRSHYPKLTDATVKDVCKRVESLFHAANSGYKLF